MDSTGKFRIILAFENFNNQQGKRVDGMWSWNKDANNVGRLKQSQGNLVTPTVQLQSMKFWAALLRTSLCFPHNYGQLLRF